MSRLIKTLVVFTLLLQKMESHKLGSQNFTNEWLVFTKNSLYSPLVTELKNDLAYLSFPSDSIIKLQTLNITHKPCQLSMNLSANQKTKLIPIFANTLGNGQIIVSFVSSKKQINESQVWMYAINPDQCSYNFHNFSLDAPIEEARTHMFIVPYEDTYDIFLKSNFYCKPDTICRLRFNDKSELVSSRNSAIRYEDKNWFITSFDDYDSDKGYMYVVSRSQSSVTLIRHLDADLSVVLETEMNHVGNMMVYWHDSYGNLSSCFGTSKHSIECVLLDARAKVKVETPIIYDKYVQLYSVIGLRNGGALLLVILSDHPDGLGSSTYVQEVDMHGDVSKPIKFQESVCSKIEDINIVEIKRDFYCISTICSDIINTRCIGLAIEN